MAGIAAGATLQPPVSCAGGLAAAALLAVWRWHRHPRAQTVMVCAAWCALGALRIAVWQAQPAQQLRAMLPDEPQAAAVHGVVRDDPVAVFSPREEAVVTLAMELYHVRLAGGWRPQAGRLRVTMQQPRAALHDGDEVLLEGEWSRIPPPGNPGQYDWRAAMARDGVQGLLRVRPSGGVAVLRAGPWTLRRTFAALRRRIEDGLARGFSRERAGLLRSIVLGRKTELDQRLIQAFVETGTVHLLVISGFNVGLIAWLTDWALRLAGVGWRRRPWLAAAGVAAYSVLVGWQPPVARAAIMAWMVLGALVLDRTVSWWNTLAAAALVMAALQPTQFFDPSFQLSFGAVASLLALTPRWQPPLEARLGWLRPGWLRRLMAGTLSATAAVWVGLTPLLAWYFHLATPVSLLANVVMVPLVSLLVGLGTPLMLLGAACEPLLRAAAIVLIPLIDATIWCVTALQHIPGGCQVVGHPPLSWVIGYYGLLGLSLARARLRIGRAGILASWVAAAALWGFSLAAERWLESRWLRVDALDVGHGDSILIQSPQGRTVLVDAGTRQAGQFRVLPALRYHGIGTLEALVLTHTDEDHLGGALPLLEQLRVGHLLTNGVRGDTMSARSVWRLARQRRVPQRVLCAGMRLDLGGGVACEVLHPPRGLVPGVAARSNDNCVVLKLTKGAVSILLTGDLEEAGVPWMLAAGRMGRITVLKVPHHGSRLGMPGEQLFAEAAPRVAIVSAGRLHHLPSAETLQALRAQGAAIFLTRDDGAVSLRTDGERLEVRAFRSEREISLAVH